MARGGYRKPNNPAPVSGPGALSRRTDGGAGSKQAMKEIRTGKYGESKAIMEQQQGAPMAGNPAPSPRVAAPKVTGLMQPTERPQEPVTEGMPFGPGTNQFPRTSELINTNNPQSFELASALEALLPYDKTGNIASLYDIAVKRGW
jgi:hypothetical protein